MSCNDKCYLYWWENIRRIEVREKHLPCFVCDYESVANLYYYSPDKFKSENRGSLLLLPHRAYENFNIKYAM